MLQANRCLLYSSPNNNLLPNTILPETLHRMHTPYTSSTR